MQRGHDEPALKRREERGRVQGLVHVGALGGESARVHVGKQRRVRQQRGTLWSEQRKNRHKQRGAVETVGVDHASVLEQRVRAQHAHNTLRPLIGVSGVFF
jgi:hypothetical protein